MAVNMNSLLYSNDENKRKAEQFLRERYGAATKEPTVNPSAFIPKKRKAEDVVATGLNTINSVLNQARIAETAKASARKASQAQNPLLNPVQTAKLSDFAKSKGIQQTVGVQKENPLDYARQQTLNSKTYKASILGMPLNNDQNQGILEEVKTENADPILYTVMQLGSGVASTPFSIQGGLSTMLSDAVTGGKTSNDFQKIAQYFEKNPERENIGLTKAESILSLGGINDLELANKIGVSPESLKRYRQSNVNDSVAQFIDNEVGATTPNWYKSSLGKAVYSIGAQVIPMMYTMGASSAVSGASSAGSDSFLGALMNGEKVSKALVNLVKPNATTILMGTSSASNKYSQLSKEYGSNPLNVVNAMATGYAEALTENLGGFTEAKSFAKMFSGESFKSNFLKYLMSMAEEGVEEVVNVPLEGITDKLTVETDKPWSGSGGVFDLENMIESGVQGALVSAIMGGSAFVSSTVNAVRQNRKVKAGVETLTGIAKTSLPGNMRPAPIDPQTATYEDFTKYALQVQDAIETFKDYVLSNFSNFTTGEYRTVSLPDGKKVLVDENNRYVSDADNASQSTSTGNNINAPANDAEAGKTTVNTNLQGHTPQEQKTILEYQNAVDPNLVNYIKNVQKNPDGSYLNFEVKPVSPREVSDIKGLTGIDITGYRHNIKPSAIEHIIKRHGKNGKADHSMANVEDIARIPYVLENYDRVERGKLPNGKERYSKAYSDRNQRPSPTVVYSKAIDGTFYVVEAVPDSNTKTLQVVSAYISKNGIKKEAYQVPDTDNRLQLNVQNEPELASTPIISASSQNSNSGNKIFSPANDAEAGRITLKEFTDNTNPVWNFVDYSDSKTKADITQKIAGEMIQAGNVVELTDSDLSKFDQYYPDLRGMKKQERTPILREKIKEVKNYLSSMLKEKFGGKTVEFTVNGNVLEAKLHDAGIREVLEKITKTKAAMIDKTGEIFSKAQYLYSASDKAGNPDIYRWNYFYVPLKINEDTLGIRIAVRDVKKANESQIYNYGIKTEATLPEGPVSGQRPDFLSDGTSVASDNAALPEGPVNGQKPNILANGHRTASTPIIPNFSQKSNAAENIVFPPYSDAMKRVVMPGITRSVKTGLSEERTVKQASSPRSEKSVTEKESHPVDDSLSFINPDVREVTTKLTETGRKVYQQLVSGQSTLERMSRIQKKLNHLKATSEELIQQYRNSGGTIDYIAEKGLVGRDGQKLGKSWKELIPQTKEGRQKLNQYMQNKHNIDRQAQGKPVLDKSAEASKAVVNSMNALDPAVSIQANEIYRFWDKFMNEWAVESGLLSKDQYSAMRKMYPNYIPTFRVDQQFNNASSAGYGSRISTSKIVKRAKGATSEIIPLEDAFMAQINKTVRAARKNEIIMDLVNFVREHPEAAAPYARLADPDSELAEVYKKGPDGFIEDVDYESVREIKKGKYQITGFENGKPVSLNVSKDVFDSVNDLFNRKVSAAEKIGKAITNPVKATTTGYNPFFAITNAVRDIQTGYVNTISDRKLFATYMADVFSAGKEMVQNSADWELYQAMGGNRSGFYNNEKGFTRSALASRNKIQKGYDLVKKAASFFGERSEQLVRFTEFKNGLKKYGRTPDGIKKAMNAAADVTVNFARSGPTTKALDSWVMYLNAGVQGLDKMARQIKTSPVKTGRRAFELIGIPTIALWLINHLNPNYDDLDDRTKDNYFIIPNLFDLDENGNAQSFIKLPKSREYGAVMGAALERCLDFAFDGVPAEKAFKNLWETFATNLAPQNPFTDNIIGQFAVNLPNNKDFAGRDIVPARLQDLEPRYQYDYNTSEIAKRLGAAFNWSPKQVDYILNNNTGIIGDILLPMTSSGQPKNLQDLAGTALSPLTRKFSADPLYQNGVVDQFYDDYDAAVRAAATSNFVNDTPAEAVTPEEKKVSFFAKISKQIAELRKEERKLLESAEAESVRRPKIEDIRKQITDLARNAEERAQAFADEYAKTYVEETSHLSEKQQETARNGKQQGISNDTYLKFLEFVKSAESDKNSEGEAIPGSKKEKIVKYLNSQSLTADQKKFLLKSIGYKS